MDKQNIIERLRQQTASLDAAGLLGAVAAEFGERIAFATSFGAEDQVITHLLCRLEKPVQIFTLDTGRLPQETYNTMERTRKHYHINIEVLVPDTQQLEKLLGEHGPNLFYESVELRKQCCHVRKVEPLRRKLAELDAWICGLRREQAVTRTDLERIEWDAANGLIKINPLADWTNEQVWQFIRDNHIPYNVLHDKGYPSIGCAPCTRAIKDGEDIRAGRWWWEHPATKECGLHLSKTRGKTIMDHLEALESQSVFILREAYRQFKQLVMLWSIGKDSTVLLWLARKAFFGHVPIPLMHIDTCFKVPQMIEYRDRLAQTVEAQYDRRQKCRPHSNQSKPFPMAMSAGLTAAHRLKSEALKRTLSGEWPRWVLDHTTGQYVRHDGGEAFTGVIVGARADEEGSRSKERYFSPRDKHSDWDIADQPPELWNQFKTDFAPGTHVRIHPLLDWTELNIWEYIERENIPVTDLYFDRGEGIRYRSLGCWPCTKPVESTAKNVHEIIEELRSGKFSNIAERSGREQDKEDGYGLETLRRRGYM